MADLMEAWHYWTKTAHTKPEAQALAARLGLEMPNDTMHEFKAGLMYPVRRLIIAGEDTPENFAILLGPQREVGAEDVIKKCRIEVLLCPPPGSPAHMMSGFLDAGSPRWTPKGPTSEEQVGLEQTRDLQKRMASSLGQ